MATNERDELARILNEWLDDEAPLNLRRYVPIADSLLAAGYRKQQTISTYEELNSLYAADANAVVMNEDGVILQNLAGGWKSPGSAKFMHSDLAFHVYGPRFTVLHVGGAE